MCGLKRNAVSLDDCTMVMQESSSIAVLGNILVKCYRLGNVVKGLGELFTLYLQVL